MRLSARVSAALLLVALVAAIGAEVAAGADTTTVVQAAGGDRSASLSVVLVGVGAVVGVIVGLIPAVVVAALLGYVPPPPRLRPAAGVLVEPPRVATAPVHDRRGPEMVAAPAAVVVPSREEEDEPPSPVAILAHARHQSVYDAAYAEQAERLEAMRTTIGRRLQKPDPGE